MTNALIYILVFIIGSLMGSFYTVVGLRMPKKEPFLIDRSRCDNCKHQLSFLDMIPIFSYVFLKGKCRYCHEKIGILSTYIEFFSGVLYAVAYYSFGLSYELFVALGIVSLFMIVIVSDLTYLIIPNGLLVFFSIYFLIFQLLMNGIKGVIYHLFIGIFLFIVMYLIMLLGNKLFKKESMGGADVKLMFIFGLIFDPILGIITIFLGSLFALPISFLLYIKKQEGVIPFGPFLLTAVAFMYFIKLTPAEIINLLNFT